MIAINANAPSADFIAQLVGLKKSIEAAPHGTAGDLYQSFCRQFGLSLPTLHRWLKNHAGYKSGRKTRKDAGKTRLDDEALTFMSGLQKEAVRGNGKNTMPTSVAMNIAAANGFEINVSRSTVNRAKKQNGFNASALENTRNFIEMRSLFANHVHQIDPSLCLIYYMGKTQKILRDEEFYKNKLENIAKIKLKVWRYVRYDHASGTVDLRYFEAAGENQQSIFEFLLYTWGKQANRLSYGVPKILIWDKGSANLSHGVQTMLNALGVSHETHFAGHSWAKGGVEQANNLVETQFESRLKAQPVDSVEALNAAAANWARDHNANALDKCDTRITRASGQKMVRDDLWQTILQTPAALIEMPSREVCGWFMHGKETTRQVRSLQISFAHPELDVRGIYDLSPWAQFLSQKEQVKVTPLLLKRGMVRVEINILGKEPKIVEVEPMRDFDQFGRSANAQVFGEGYSRAKETAGEAAAKKLIAAAYGDGLDLDDADKLRAKQTKPFAHMNNGKGVVAHSHLGKAELPSRILPAATELITAQITAAKNTRIETAPYSLAEACKFIKGIQGANYNTATYAWLAARFADGVIPQTYAEELARGTESMAAQATGTDSNLRIIK